MAIQKKTMLDWKVQQASGLEQLTLNWREKFFLSKKLNGNRCSYINGRLINRQGREVAGMQHILNDIELLGLDELFLDGELLRSNIDGVTDGENFRISNGIINSDADEKTEIQFVLFDMFPADEFCSGASREKYSDRRQKLIELKSRIAASGAKNIDVVQMVYEGTHTSQIDRWLRYAVAHDWEGLVLNKDTPYCCKRTTDLIKVKHFRTVDLEVIDVAEGSGRLSGTLGALVVCYKGNAVNVGAGFDNEQRAELWSLKNSVIGRVVEVQYKEESTNKRTGLCSLQFPSFVCLREQGKAPSYEA